MKTTLFILLIALSMSAQSQINLDSGLVAHYAFEGNANDSSPFAFHGTASNVTYSTGVYGAPNSSALFDGSGTSYIDCGTDNRGISDTIAISAFFRTTFSGIGDIVSKYDAGNDAGYHLEMSLGKIRFAGRDGGGSYRSTGFSLNTVNDSMWHHVLGVVRGNTWLLYIDCNLEGAQSNSTVNPDVSSAANLGIGKDVFTDAKYLDCEVDEVRIYNRELWQDEMDSLCATAVFASVDEPIQHHPHIQIYPNPATHQIALALDLELIGAQAEIVNLNGQTIENMQITELTQIIDVSTYDPGLYFLRIIHQDRIHILKFQKL